MHADWMTDQNGADNVAALMRILADTTRLRLLGLLNRGEMNVSSLCDLTRLPQPTVSHHLGLLRNAALVVNRRDGKQVFYSLHPQNVESLSRPPAGTAMAIRIGQVELRLSPTDQPAPVADSRPHEGHATPAL